MRGAGVIDLHQMQTSGRSDGCIPVEQESDDGSSWLSELVDSGRHREDCSNREKQKGAIAG